MKNFLLFVLLFSAVSFVNAQSFQLYNEEGVEVPNGVNLDVTVYNIDDFEIVSTPLYIKNITDNSIDVILKQYALEIVDGAAYSFCGLGNCYTPGVNETAPYTLKAQTPTEDQPEFTGHYHPMGFSGVAKIRYTYFDSNNPSDSISFTATFADLASIDTPFQLLDHMGNYIMNGDNINVDVEDLSAFETISEDYYIKNSTSDVVEVMCRQEAVSLVEGASFSFCVLGVCYPAGTNETTKSVLVGPGVVVDEENYLSGHYHPDNNPGVSVIRYTFYNNNQVNDSLSFTITFDGTTGVDNVMANSKITVSPNPASEYVVFNTSDVNIGNSQLVIYDLTGKVVYSENAENKSQIELDLSEFTRGVYLYRIEGESKMSETSKLIIQ